MDGPRGEPAESRYDELHAEAAEALGFAANTLRGIRDRYRQAYLDEMARSEDLNDDLAALERAADGPPSATPETSSEPSSLEAAEAAEAGAADLQLRLVRAEAGRSTDALGRHEAELSRLELAIRNLETTWLFLERGDASLVTDLDMPLLPTDLQMRIVEAQEAERVRLAQEIHDGPAQALSNAIFQVEFIDRVFESDPAMAREELRLLRDLLRAGPRRRPHLHRPAPAARPRRAGARRVDRRHREQPGGPVRAADHDRARGPAGDLPEATQTVVLRVVQEALQNVRKHAGATNVVVASMLDDGEWVLEVRDDGRGFDTGAVAARGRRNFGLQFMRERAELIGARFEVHSRPEAGTVVRLAIPMSRKESG